VRLIDKIKNWEQWPFKILYAPVSPVWAWYIIRSRAIWFFTPSNPKLTFGGMEGEPKKEMHVLLPEHLCPSYFNILPGESFENIIKQLKEKNISYPLIVKPEIGGQGILFRKINNETELKNYHRLVPVEYFIQEFINYPIEVSLFYYRFPGESKGVITGFLKKIPMQVTGDGVHTIEELIMVNAKMAKRIKEIRNKHADNLKKVLAKNEKYMLSYAANHNRGAQFIDLKEEIEDSLVKVLDDISLSINDFFYGRYDIMCNSIAELKQGKNFVILEYNGCGAEPNHFYDTGYTLMNAWQEILKHWKVLFRISKINNASGIKYWPAMKGFRFRQVTKKHYKKIKTADKQIP